MHLRFAVLYIYLLGSVSCVGFTVSCDQVSEVFKKEGLLNECPKDPILGEGSSAITFKLVTESGAVAAGKVVSITTQDEKKKYLHEVSLLETVRGHPNVINLYYAKPNEDYGYMLLEYGEHGDLDTFLKNNRALFQSPSFVLKFFLNILEGVQYIHERKIVHTDLKALNIVVGSQGRPKIIDFDTSRTIGYTGDLQGTPYYLDPIQLTQEGAPYTPNTDIHALGVILYEMVHKQKKPYTAQTLVALTNKIIMGAYTIDQGTHWLVAFLIVKCLAAAPAHRMSVPDMISLIKSEIKYVSHTPQKSQSVNFLNINAKLNPVLSDYKPTTPMTPVEPMKLVDRDGNEWSSHELSFIIQGVDKETRELELLGIEKTPKIKLAPLKVTEIDKLKSRQQFKENPGVFGEGKQVYGEKLTFNNVFKVQENRQNRMIQKIKGQIKVVPETRNKESEAVDINENKNGQNFKSPTEAKGFVVNGPQMRRFKSMLKPTENDLKGKLPQINLNGQRGVIPGTKKYLRRLSQTFKAPQSLGNGQPWDRAAGSGSDSIGVMAILWLVVVISLKLVIDAVRASAGQRKAEVVQECSQNSAESASEGEAPTGDITC
jgi:serine/threonine protein kinase